MYETNELALKPSELIEDLPHMIKLHYPVMITGMPGVGKTSVIVQIAAKMGADLHIWMPAVSEPTDYKGYPYVTEHDYAEFKLFKELEFLITASTLTICFFDDLGQAAPSVQKALMQLILARELNGKKISSHIVFIGATNRRQDGAGVKGVLEPVKGRFHSIVELKPCHIDWQEWAVNNGQPAEMIAFVGLKPDLLENGFKPTADLTNSPTPRTIANAGDVFNSGINPARLHKWIAGSAGAAFCAEFMGFIDIWQKLPNPAAILMDPTTGQVPNDPAVLYALVAALATKITDVNSDSFFVYLHRVETETSSGKEFSVLAVTLARRQCPEIESTRPFIEWVARNQKAMN